MIAFARDLQRFLDWNDIRPKRRVGGREPARDVDERAVLLFVNFESPPAQPFAYSLANEGRAHCNAASKVHGMGAMRGTVICTDSFEPGGNFDFRRCITLVRWRLKVCFAFLQPHVWRRRWRVVHTGPVG